MRAAFAVVFCLPLVLTGCSLSPTTTETTPDAGVAIRGRVYGGQQPIAGAHVYLFAAGAGVLTPNVDGYGNASVSLLGYVPDSTTLDTSGGATNGDYYVTTGPDGSFSITNDYSCTANTQVYLYALDGNPGLAEGTNNTSAGLLAVLGNCPGGSNAFLSGNPYVVINEVTTVAAAYAFAGFATDATDVSSPSTAQAELGIKNAFANAASLATLSTGAAPATTPSNGMAPQATVYTLANILASCVNTDGTVSAGPPATPCDTLFTSALSGGTAGTQPKDTATAAINIAHNPAANVDALWGLVTGTAAFGSGLAEEPNDFSLAVQFTDGGVNTPTYLAIDGSGNAWILNNPSIGSSSVSELNSLGAPAPNSPYTAGGMEGLVSLAIDLTGNAWIANDISATTGSVIELNSSGVPATNSPFTNGGLAVPYGIAIDGAGNVWVTNSNNSTVAKLTSSGGTATGSPFSSGGLDTPYGIAIDESGNAWIANYGSSTVTELNNAGTPSLLSPYNGSLYEPYGVAMDGGGNAWIASAANSTVVELNSSGTPAMNSPYSGGGLSNPVAVAMDGSGNAWVANEFGGSIVEFSNTGAPLSGPNGLSYNSGSIDVPDTIAVDSSGNVWVGNLGGTGVASNGSVTELIGAATPVVTPLAVGVKNSTLGARP